MGLGEGTLMLSDIRRLGPFLGVQILNFRGEGVQKEDFFRGGGGWDMMTLWAFGGGGIAKLDYFLELFLNLRLRYRIGIFFGGC